MSDNETPLTVKSLPTKSQGRPLLLGLVLDKAVQDYITSLRGVVNMSIVMSAAESLLTEIVVSLLSMVVT